ncbi:hypothetical protein ABIC60_003724 [Phyllobacterium ifriqiyense]
MKPSTLTAFAMLILFAAWVFFRFTLPLNWALLAMLLSAWAFTFFLGCRRIGLQFGLKFSSAMFVPILIGTYVHFYAGVFLILLVAIYVYKTQFLCRLAKAQLGN